MISTPASQQDLDVRHRYAPWFAFLFIGVVFFYTLHNVFHTRDYVEGGATAFIPSDQVVEELVAGWETGKIGSGLAYLSLGVLGLLGFLLKARNRLKIDPLIGRLSLVYVLWAAASIAWAQNFRGTWKAVVILAMVCLALTYVARRFSDHDLLLFTFVTMGTYLLIGLASEAVLGAFRPWTAGYRFSGTCHPNGQALGCAMFFIAAVYMSRDQHRRLFFIAAGFVAFACLVLTKSRTSLVSAMVAPIAVAGLVSSRVSKAALIFFAGTFVSLFLLVETVAGPAIDEALLMGRLDTNTSQTGTLTGRTFLWLELITEYIPQHPFGGYGYNSFWDYEHVEAMSDVVDFMATTAHSVYVEVWLGLGPLGLILYLVIHLAALARALAYYRTTREPAYGFFSAILVYTLLVGLTESGFLFAGLTTFTSMAVVVKLGFQAPPTEYAEQKRLANSRFGLNGPMPGRTAAPDGGA